MPGYFLASPMSLFCIAPVENLVTTEQDSTRIKWEHNAEKETGLLLKVFVRLIVHLPILFAQN